MMLLSKKFTNNLLASASLALLPSLLVAQTVLEIDFEFINKTVNIYEDSQLLACDIPFIDPTVSSLNQFTISEGRTLLFDYYYTGEENPLFVDNGTGLLLSYGARGSDGDFDEVLSIEEFLLGLVARDLFLMLVGNVTVS